MPSSEVNVLSLMFRRCASTNLAAVARAALRAARHFFTATQSPALAVAPTTAPSAFPACSPAAVLGTM